MGRCSDARGRLLREGGRLIHARGYEAVSVADICQAAGLQKGSFYHFFPSKRDLVLAVLDEIAAHERTAWQDVLARPRDEQLAFFLRRIETTLTEGAEEAGCVRGCPVGNLAMELSTRDPEVRARIATMLAAWQAQLAEVIVATGLAADHVSALPRAQRLLALIQGALLLAKATNDPGVFSQVAAGETPMWA